MERNSRGAITRLSLCFIAGAALGQVLALGVPDATAQELRRTLSDYYSRESALNMPLALRTLAAWLRVPALTFLWGFTSVGVPLVWLTAAGFGFALSFSIGCFAAAFGWEGVALSAAAMGVRVLITLPCFFPLALTSMERAAWLFRPNGKARPNRRALALTCAAVLLAGAALDLYVTPRLLRLVLDWLSAPPRTGFPFPLDIP